MLATLTRADALVVRPPHAAPLPAGTPVPVLRLPQAEIATRLAASAFVPVWALWNKAKRLDYVHDLYIA